MMLSSSATIQNIIIYIYSVRNVVFLVPFGTYLWQKTYLYTYSLTHFTIIENKTKAVRKVFENVMEFKIFYIWK